MTLVETPGEERNGDLSPDGRWLAYEGESQLIPGQLDIYVRPFPDVNRGLWQVTRDGGTFPVWSRDGRELFYARLDGTIVAVPSSRDRRRPGTPETRRSCSADPISCVRGASGDSTDVAPDGRFLMLKRAATSVSPHLVLVQNWLADVASRLP